MPREAVIYKIGYEVEGSTLIVNAHGRDAEGQRVNLRITGTEPHFYALQDDAERLKAMSEVVSVTPGPPDPSGRPTVRVQTRYPYDVPVVRKLVAYHYEADVVYPSRVRIDYRLTHIEVPDGPGNLTIPISHIKPLSTSTANRIIPRILYFDIETEDQFGFSRPERPESPVLSVGFKDTKKNALGCIYHGQDLDPEAVRKEMNAHLPADAQVTEPIRLFPQANEHDVLGAFGALLAKMEPDILAAYNGEKYDFPYLAGRASRLSAGDPGNGDLKFVLQSFPGMDVSGRSEPAYYQTRGRHVLADPLAIYRKQELRQRAFSLEAVSQDTLGYGKLPRDTTVGELRRKDPVRFIAYNLLDVVCMERVDKRRRLIDYALGIAFTANVEIPDMLHNSRVVDAVLFSIARENGPPSIVLPSSSFAPALQKRGKGAEVFPTIAGEFEGVCAVDFAEEYPSIIQTFNISPETRVAEGTPDAYVLPSGGCYRKTPKGIIYRGLSRMRAARKVVKDKAKRLPLGSPEREDADLESKAIKFTVNCLPPEATIATTRGPVRIEEVHTGDTVFSYDHVHGTTQNKVKAVWSAGKKPVFKITTKTRSVRASANHPFLVAEWVPLPVRGKYGRTGDFELKWKALSDIQTGQHILIANHLPMKSSRHVLPDGTDADEDFCRFLGCFAGDGWVTHSHDKRRVGPRKPGNHSKGRGGNQFGSWNVGDPIVSDRLYVELALYGEERRFYHDLAVRRLGWKAPERPIRYSLKVGGEALGRLMVDIGMDRPAHQKQLPAWVFGLPTSCIWAIISGMVDSNGWVTSGRKEQANGHEYWGFVSTSLVLVEQLQFLCHLVGLRVGRISHSKHWNDDVKNKNKQGFPIVQRHTAYSLRMYPNGSVPKRPGQEGQQTPSALMRLAKKIPEGFELQAVRSIEADGESETYDIEVEGAHNFVADGVVVHNSFAGVLGSRHWRLGDVAMFEDITGMSRLQLGWKRSRLTDPEWMTKVVGFPAVGKVILGDTDSAYFQVIDRTTQTPVTDVSRLHSEIVPKIVSALNESYGEWVARFGATENLTSDSLEGIFERFRTLPGAKGAESNGDGDTLGAKKRYFGLFAFDGEKDVRSLPFDKRVKYAGVEVKRHNVAPISKFVQTRLIELVLKGRPDDEKVDFLDGIRDEVYQGKHDESLFIPTSLSKERSAYRSVPDFIRAIDNYQELTGKVISEGDEFKWTYVLHGVRYTKSGNGAGSGFEEFAIPAGWTFAETKERGFIFDIDRVRAVEKMVDDPARLVAPEVDGRELTIADGW